MKNKDKELKPIQTVLDLTTRIVSKWREREEEALLLQKDQNERLDNEKELESTIINHLKNLRSVASKLENDYPEIQARITKEKKARIEKESVRELDVINKKVSLKEFASKGKSEKEISEQVIEETEKELQRTLAIIRKQNLEIFKVERSLSVCQANIRSLMLAPIRILRKSIKDNSDILEQEYGLFLDDSYGQREDIQLIDVKLHLATKGTCLSSGYAWEAMPVEDAKRIIFSPIIPEDVIPELLKELAKCGNAIAVTVSYGWRGREVAVRPHYKPLAEKEKIVETKSAILHRRG